MNGIHILDILVVVAYLVAIIYIGRRAKSQVKSEEGYFLAGRKLGKLYQIFLNFGNATEPSGAVTNARFVFQYGAFGAWYSFQTIFMNPYYWFMNVWFRRVRLTTMGDLFEDRFNSKNLARFYALFQMCVAVLLIGFGTYTAYTITASLVTKPESAWTAQERSSVEGYRSLDTLEKKQAVQTLDTAEQTQLSVLRDKLARKELTREVSYLAPAWCKWTFYIVFMSVVAIYMALGGMTAAAFNEALQGMLIIVFSVLLIPTGIHYIGGWSAFHKLDPSYFNLFSPSKASLAAGASMSGGWTILAITLTSLIQMNALSPNMNIMGSAKNEYAARIGVVGLYGKRFMIILWTFAGLLAVAIFTGDKQLSDPNMAWGALSKELLGPGLIGLMLAGVIAAVMSNLSAKSMAVSSLFVKNFCRHIWPDLSEIKGMMIARWTIVGVMAIGLLAATTMTDFEQIVRLVITVNTPFGAAILLLFFWRRLTVKAVWTSLLLSITLNIVVPLIGTSIPAISSNKNLTVSSLNANGRPVPVYFDSVVHSDPNDINSPLQGRGRFNMEVFMVSRLGVDVEHFTPAQRMNTTYFWDGLFPFAALIVVSLLTRDKDSQRVDFFYGKMKTPVADTPELDVAEMEKTRKDPHRFDDSKLFGRGSSWEFGKWTRQDAVGFILCVLASLAIIYIFIVLLRLAVA